MVESNSPIMIVVFFFYGLSFFLLGASISLQSRKGSEFKFGECLWLLAAYGLLHGSKEWLEMFTMIGKPVWTGHTVEVLTIIRFFLAMVSFIFLFLFGLDLIVPEKSKKQTSRIATVSLSCITGIFFVLRCLPDFGTLLAPHLDSIVRYCFGFPAIGLTAYAFFRQKQSTEIRQLNSSSLQHSLSVAAILLVVYAILDGLFIEHDSFFPATILSYKNFVHAAGLPVQVFRTMCAFGILYCMLRILNIFELEKKFKLENAYKEIIRISTSEHERIGQDIHDGLCQELTGILLHEKVLEKRLDDLKLPEAAQMKKITELTDQTISHSRALSKSLYPVEIEEHGLVYALLDLADTVEEIYGGITCTVKLEANIAVKDHIVANHLFRITQEAITNAVKHGKATSVTVFLQNGPDGRIILSIVDNGSGIALPPDSSNGMGLKIMKYRAKVIDGTLEISRHKKGGTQVICTFRHGEK